MAERATARTRKPPAARKAVGEQPAPLVLAGPPHALRGRITLANAGIERLVIRGALMHLPGRDPIVVPLTVLIAPGSTADVAVSADLGGSWPPGSVRGELEVNGQRREVEVRVDQSFALSVSPAELLATAGTTQVHLIVRNFGNVPLPLARVTRGCLVAHDSGDRHESGDPHVEPSDATLTIAKPITIAPGDEAVLTAGIDVPGGLAPDRRHRARLPLGPADLLVTVLPTDPPTALPSKARTRTTTRKES